MLVKNLALILGGDGSGRGTNFEQSVQSLMETEGGDEGIWASPVWRTPIMTYSKDPITSPLTTFTSDVLQAEALKLFKVRKILHRKIHFRFTKALLITKLLELSLSITFCPTVDRSGPNISIFT